MTDEIYRRGYGVETRVREPTPEEAARVDAEVRRWNDEAWRQHSRRMRDPVRMLIAAVLALLISLAVHKPPAIFATGFMAVLLAVLMIPARKKSLATLAASRGPWHPPEGGWKVKETLVFARSVTAAASDDEDYVTWLLFEIPGGDWYYVDPSCVSNESARDPKTLARAELRLVRLWPEGQFLEVTATGDAIDWRGDGDYAELAAAGKVWRPDDEGPEHGADGTIPERSVPEWARR